MPSVLRLLSTEVFLEKFTLTGFAGSNQNSQDLWRPLPYLFFYYCFSSSGTFTKCLVEVNTNIFQECGCCKINLVGEQGHRGGVVSNYCVLVSFHGSTKKKLLYNLRKSPDNDLFFLGFLPLSVAFWCIETPWLHKVYSDGYLGGATPRHCWSYHQQGQGVH